MAWIKMTKGHPKFTELHPPALAPPPPNPTRAGCLKYISSAVAVAVHCSCWKVLRVIVEYPNELVSNAASLAGRLPNGHLVKAAGASGQGI